MTHQYELMVILDPEIDERTVAPSLDKFLNVIRNDGGSIDNIDIWGRRRLAYEIQKKSEGIYAVVNFTATSESTVELDRQLKLSEAVLRTKVLRAEEAVARAISVRAEDEKRAARKAAAAAKSPVKPAATATAPTAEAAAEPAAAEPKAAEPKAAKAAPKAKAGAAPAAQPAAEPAAESAATEGE
jgi:small subunit ribosomal protein S6